MRLQNDLSFEMQLTLEQRSNYMHAYLNNTLLCVYAYYTKLQDFAENFGQRSYEDGVLQKTLINTQLDHIYLRLANLADRDERVCSFPQLKEAVLETITDIELRNKIEDNAQNLYSNHLEKLNKDVRNKYVAHIGHEFEGVWSLFNGDKYDLSQILTEVLDYYDLLTQKKNTFPTKFGSHNLEFDMRAKLFS